MPVVFIRGMNSSFRRRQRKNQPSTPGIDMPEAEYIAEESAVSFGVFAVNDDMSTKDHNTYCKTARIRIMQTKLTLSISPPVVARAKRYAKQQGISVSHMVEAYLASVTAPAARETEFPPVLSAFQGILKKGDPEDYRKHLRKKYL